MQKKKKASAALDSMMQMLIVAFILLAFILMIKPFMVKMNVDYLTKEVVRVIEVAGKYDTTTVEQAVNNLSNGLVLGSTSSGAVSKSNFTGTNIKYSLPANNNVPYIYINVNSASKHGRENNTCSSRTHSINQKYLNLRGTFTVTINTTVYFDYLGARITMPIHKTLKGISQVYHK
ncbi:MAG: DUF4320 family protein [Clostridiales bacterium]|nr:DUF4320 family protein [Clostridiales bacterium]